MRVVGSLQPSRLVVRAAPTANPGKAFFHSLRGSAKNLPAPKRRSCGTDRPLQWVKPWKSKRTYSNKSYSTSRPAAGLAVGLSLPTGHGSASSTRSGSPDPHRAASSIFAPWGRSLGFGSPAET
ncbi:MAG: hypothetical protein EWM72_03238 [Nitrospira sp.]|nr:MAG: hypothetical protein EWM72_03238 [Nitrospira sp.]